ncbi:MAG: helix-turn-helix transcriptional regulator [Clostridia bacterium]|nr:helix-turn-helix transcriptional regulator [Clostridia bacterium]
MKNTIGKQLKDLRKELGLTQLEVANKLNISRVNYTRYETDAVCPDFDTLIDIADFYNVSLDYLFNRTLEN